MGAIPFTGPGKILGTGMLRALLSAIALCCFVSAVKASTSDALLEQAVALHEAGKPAEAIAFFQEALRTEPGSLRAHEGLAWAYYDLGNFVEAASHADQRRALAPDDLEWRRHWALIVFAVASRRDEVLETATGWLQEDPDSNPARLVLGRILADMGRYQEGRRVLEDALARQPINAQALRILASIERWDHNLRRALRLLERASVLQPDDGDLRNEVQEIRAELARLRAARLEPTLPLTIAVMAVSILIGQTSERLHAGALLRLGVGIVVLTAVALAWLQLVPIG